MDYSSEIYRIQQSFLEISGQIWGIRILMQNRTFTPHDYAPIFKKLGVKSVVRLNNKTYDSNEFVKNGINHHELYFADGSVPSIEIVNKFLQISE